MLLDTIHGTIDRRLLLNFRINPDVLQKVLPAPFRPKTYAGWGIGGICMIRFHALRPRHVPAWLGVDSENAAHRFAVEWEQDGETKEGVYIPRRDTNSGFNQTFGGKVFPGIFNRSTFHVRETATTVSIQIMRGDGGEEVAVSAENADALPPTSIFPSVTEAAGFFSLGATGYSATRQPDHYHGMELRSLDWTIAPLHVIDARSRFFSDPAFFPEGSVTLDGALIMRKIAHEWHSRPDLHLAANGRELTARL
jgi:hypothetical protein